MAIFGGGPRQEHVPTEQELRAQRRKDRLAELTAMQQAMLADKNRVTLDSLKGQQSANTGAGLYIP